MPRKGQITVAGTSMPKIIGELMDKFIAEKQSDLPLLKLSRSKVIELAVLKFLDEKGVLDKFLADLGYEGSESKKIKQYLQAVL